MIQRTVFGRYLVALASVGFLVTNLACSQFGKKSDSMTLGLAEDGDSDLAYTFVPVFNSLPYATKGVDLKNPGVQFAMDMIEDFAHLAYVECHSTPAMSANLWVMQLENDAVSGIEGTTERVYVDGERNLFIGTADPNSNARPAVVKKSSGYPCTVMPKRFLSAPTVALLLDSLTNTRALSQTDLATAQFIYLAMRGYELKDGRGLTPLQQAYIKIAVTHSDVKTANEISAQLDALDRDLNPCSAELPSAKYTGEAKSWRDKNFKCFVLDTSKGLRGYSALTSDFGALRTTVLSRIDLMHNAAYKNLSSASVTDKIWAALTYSADLSILAASKAPEAEAAKLLLGQASSLSLNDAAGETYAATKTTASLTSGFALLGNGSRNGTTTGQRGQAGTTVQGARPGQICGCSPNRTQVAGTRTTPPNNYQAAGGRPAQTGKPANTTQATQAAQNGNLRAADKDTLRGWNFSSSTATTSGPPKVRTAAETDALNKQAVEDGRTQQLFQKPAGQTAIEDQMRNAVKAKSEGKTEENGMKILGVQGTNERNQYVVAEYKTATGTAYAYQTRDGSVTTQIPAATTSVAGKAMGATPAGTTNYVTQNAATVYRDNQPVAGTGVTYDPKQPGKSEMFMYSSTPNGQVAAKLPTTYDAATNTVAVKPGPEATAAIAKVAAQGSDAAALQKAEKALCANSAEIKQQKELIASAGGPDKPEAAANVARLKEMTGQFDKDQAAYKAQATEAMGKLKSAEAIDGSGIKFDETTQKYVAVDTAGKPVEKVAAETQKNLDQMSAIHRAADGKCGTTALTSFALDDGCGLTSTEGAAAAGSGVGDGKGTEAAAGAIAEKPATSDTDVLADPAASSATATGSATADTPAAGAADPTAAKDAGLVNPAEAQLGDAAKSGFVAAADPTAAGASPSTATPSSPELGTVANDSAGSAANPIAQTSPADSLVGVTTSESPLTATGMTTESSSFFGNLSPSGEAGPLASPEAGALGTQQPDTAATGFGSSPEAAGSNSFFPNYDPLAFDNSFNSNNATVNSLDQGLMTNGMGNAFGDQSNFLNTSVQASGGFTQDVNQYSAGSAAADFAQPAAQPAQQQQQFEAPMPEPAPVSAPSGGEEGLY